MQQRVFVDSNILFSKTLMDWLFLLQIQTQVYTTIASTDILAEVLYHIRRKAPHAQGSLIRDRLNLIRNNVGEIFDDFPTDLAFSGDDKDDYHVHAAATASGAEILLTNNSSTDITNQPNRESYTIYTADEFFLLMTDTAPRG